MATRSALRSPRPRFVVRVLKRFRKGEKTLISEWNPTSQMPRSIYLSPCFRRNGMSPSAEHYLKE